MKLTRLISVTVLTLLTASCAPGGLYRAPLPGGAAVGERPYRITVNFTDALDLVPQSAVKVNDVAVGRVEDVDLSSDGRSARVRLAIRKDTGLPANAVARLRQTSILGEKFVELAPPEFGQPSGMLWDGTVIPLDRTQQNPQLEEVLGALSVLLNGGGVAQLKNITTELNAALGGNEGSARELLSTLDTFMAGLDEHKAEITRALDGVNRLAATLDANKDKIGDVLDKLPEGIEVLAQQREVLTRMLRSLDNLTTVAVDTVHKSKDDLVADLRALQPTLRELAESGAALPRAMETLLTFPFPDATLDAIKGDYLNAHLNLKTAPGGAP